MRLIDADALMEQVNRKKSEVAKARYTDGFNDAILRVRSMIHSAPTVETEPIRHGRCKKSENCEEFWGFYYECKECGCIMMVFDKDFNDLEPRCCPNCKVNMEGEIK